MLPRAYQTSLAEIFNLSNLHLSQNLYMIQHKYCSFYITGPVHQQKTWHVNKRVKRLQSQWLTSDIRWPSDVRNEKATVEQDAGRCSWLALEKHAALAAKGGTHLLRSPGRSLLQSPLENLAQILDTEARISAGGQRGDREQHRPRQNQSKHQPTTTSTGHMYIYNRENQQRAWNMKKRERKTEIRKIQAFQTFIWSE